MRHSAGWNPVTDGQRTFLTLLQSQGAAPPASGDLGGGSIVMPPPSQIAPIPDAHANGSAAIAWNATGSAATTRPRTASIGAASLAWTSYGSASHPASIGSGEARALWSANGSATEDRTGIMEKIKRIDEQTIMFLMVDRWRSERATHTIDAKSRSAR